MFLHNPVPAFNNCLLFISKNATTTTCKTAATPTNTNPSIFPQFIFFFFFTGGGEFAGDLWLFLSWLEGLLSEVGAIFGEECIVGGGAWWRLCGGTEGRRDGDGRGGGGRGRDLLDGGGADFDPGFTFCWDCTGKARKQKQTPKVKINNGESIHGQIDH